jgi:hypothetical protein
MYSKKQFSKLNNLLQAHFERSMIQDIEIIVGNSIIRQIHVKILIFFDGFRSYEHLWPCIYRILMLRQPATTCQPFVNHFWQPLLSTTFAKGGIEVKVIVSNYNHKVDGSGWQVDEKSKWLPLPATRGVPNAEFSHSAGSRLPTFRLNRNRMPDIRCRISVKFSTGTIHVVKIGKLLVFDRGVTIWLSLPISILLTCVPSQYSINDICLISVDTLKVCLS